MMIEAKLEAGFAYCLVGSVLAFCTAVYTLHAHYPHAFAPAPKIAGSEKETELVPAVA